MKKVIFFLGMLFCIIISGQITDIKSTAPATISAVPHYEDLKTKINLEGAVTKADKAPEFPGGMTAFYREFRYNMDIISAKYNKIDIRVYFIVEKNGYVRDVTAIGENKKHLQAAETAIRRMFVRWKPATINNEPVRFLYTFPLSLKKY
ncbi:hypothetical protein HNP38_002157 [Chryseobacterium defluvii]|uniref:TonB-like protein n=1 Tax=Chryseobacterium defluvii TaxID=160396 RepID=A0A840KBS4_9FLAO|nr:hypothetical protein [Chryseobacterium defluvii]MBB4806861.1 hypothetical protein [Chryseobacterium defluvii]